MLFFEGYNVGFWRFLEGMILLNHATTIFFSFKLIFAYFDLSDWCIINCWKWSVFKSQNHDFAIEDLRICQVKLPYIFWRWFTWWIFWDLRHFLAWRLWSSRAVIKLSQFRVTCLIFPSTPFLSLKASLKVCVPF